MGRPSTLCASHVLRVSAYVRHGFRPHDWIAHRQVRHSASMSDTFEIERKFLLSAAPPSSVLGEGQEIFQAYVAANGVELRVRRRADECTMTAKSGGDMVRREWETTIPLWVYDGLARNAVGVVRKVRYAVFLNGRTIEVDEYLDQLQGLWTAECEFSSEAEAAGFSPPPWMAKAVDVTGDSAYKNRALACNARVGPQHR